MMKKVLTVLTVMAVLLSFGTGVSACKKCCKRPVEMDKSEKILKNKEDAKKQAIKEKLKKAEEETQTEE